MEKEIPYFFFLFPGKKKGRRKIEIDNKCRRGKPKKGRNIPVWLHLFLQRKMGQIKAALCCCSCCCCSRENQSRRQSARTVYTTSTISYLSNGMLTRTGNRHGFLPASFTGCLAFSKKVSSRFFAPEALKKKKPFSQKKFPLSFEIRVIINIEPHVSYQVFICFLINQFSRSWSQLAISFAIHRDSFFFSFLVGERCASPPLPHHWQMGRVCVWQETRRNYQELPGARVGQSFVKESSRERDGGRKKAKKKWNRRRVAPSFFCYRFDLDDVIQPVAPVKVCLSPSSSGLCLKILF